MAGKEALNIIKQQFGIQLPEDEADFIIMHIVEAQMNQTIDDLDGLTQFIQKVILVIKKLMNIPLITIAS